MSFVSNRTLALDNQHNLSEFGRAVWLTENGLPQNTIHSVIQTSDGYIWIATDEGLARFDGIRFAVFDKQNTPELKSNEIRALMEDRQGALWIGTSRGLVRLREGKFTAFTAKKELSEQAIESVYEDREGNIWIASSTGLSRFQNGDINSLAVQENFENKNVQSFFEDNDGALWIGATDGLSRFKDGEIASYTARDGLASNSVVSISQDKNGRLWFGTSDGLTSLKDGQFRTYTTRDGLPNNRITSLYADKEESLWIGTSSGLCRFNDNGFSTFKPGDSLSRNIILSIFEDREGSLWVGTESGGLSLLKDKKFTTYTVEDGLANDLVKSVYEDRQGSLWFGTYEGLSQFKNGHFTNYTTQNGLSSNIVLALFDDAKGNLWIGTPDGLNRFKNGKFTIYTSADGLSNDFIRSIYEDHAGNLWIGTRGGLTRLKDEVFTIYTTQDGLPNDFVGTLYEDREGALWIGTLGGLCRFKDGKFTTYTTANGLSSDVVISLYEDAEGDLWIGTNGGGLNRLKEGKFTAYTTKDGLYNDVVYRIMEDGQGNLWMSCSKGIFRVDKKELNDFALGKRGSINCVVYGTADGMLTRECSGGGHPAGWRSRDGKLWLSTIKGVAMIDPAKIKINTQPPPVVIEQIRIDDETIAPNQSIELPPGKSRFDFYYTGLSFIAPEKVRFKYKLEGFDADWVDGGTRRVAYYTNLKPGSYKFRVIACNNDGIWNEQGASFNLRLKPYFYQTYWFYALCVMSLALLVWLLYRLRLKQMESQFAAVLSERNRIAREIHDNLAQEILGISVQLELVSRLMSVSTEAAKTHLDRARILVRNSINEARRYVWDLRSQTLENNDLPAALTEMARRLTAETSVQVQVQVSGAFRPLPPRIESNLLRIGQESINNALKHAQADRILVQLNFESKRVQLSVRDNGRGFDPETKNGNGHFGLIGMRERAEQMDGTLHIRSGADKGTEVLVDVPLNG